MSEYDRIEANMLEIGLESDDEKLHVFLMRYRRSQYDVSTSKSFEEDVFGFE